MKNRAGIGLVEILVALAILGVLVAAVNGGMLSSLQLRRSDQQRLIAQQYAWEGVELFKNYWSVTTNYETNDAPSSNPLFEEQFASYKEREPSFANVTFAYACLSVNGTLLMNPVAPTATATEPAKLNCTTTKPDLRRVTVTVTNQQGKQLARLVTEVGKP
jgi:prepilin-type N-terminal cleavage/methylation domain-containing protein